MLYLALFILLEAVLLLANYVPGTYLLGWDNVMPEFNIGLNFNRALFSVWQDYRGLGLLDGMAHAANLVHTLFIFLLSLFIPQNLIRYVFLSLTHLAGGIFFFLLANNLLKTFKILPKNTSMIAFFGALFYMFNIGVIQMFYAPLEVFAVHFAALPLLALLIKRATEKTSPKNLLALFVASFLVSPQGFVPTLFGVFLILFLTLAVFDFIENRNFKKIAIIGLVILLANAFWLLPYSYSALKTSKVIQNTRINQFSSEEIYFRNRAQGDIDKVLTMKGFMLDSVEHDSKQNKDVFLMEKWRNHYNNPLFKLITIMLLLASFFGMLITIFKKQTKLYPFLVTFTVSFLFLANNTPGVSILNDLFRHYLPTLGEALRFPFTKFIILFAFSMSIFLTIGLLSILNNIQQLIKNKFAIYGFSITYVLAIFWIAQFAFTGHFFSPLLKVSLPNEYKELFVYFNSKDPNARIALLPTYTFWNWQYRNWGHFGSGFDWYAIKQPILERAFDPWSNFNEQFYNELSYAINSDDKLLFEKVLKKYDVSYLLIDETIENSLTHGGINYPRLENFIQNNSAVEFERKIGSQIIYKVKDANKSIYFIPDPLKVHNGFSFSNQDAAFIDFQQIISGNMIPDTAYLLPSLYTGKLQSDLAFTARTENDIIKLEAKKHFVSNEKNTNVNLELPSLFNNEFVIPVEIQVQNNTVTALPLYPKVIINGKETIQPQEQTIISNTQIDNPISIEFTDTQMEGKMIANKTRGYILNNNKNLIKIKGTSSEELVTLDTNNVPDANFLIPIQTEKIEKVEIIVDKFDSTLNVNNIIQQKAFQIKKSHDSFGIIPKQVTTNKITPEGVLLQALGNSSVDLNFYIDNLPHQSSYIMFVKSKHRLGLPVNFYVENSLNNRVELDTKLSKSEENNIFVLPQSENAFKGYGFHFIVKSVGSEYSESVIENIEMYPIPEETINHMKYFMNTNHLNLNKERVNIDFEKRNPSLYITNLDKLRDNSYFVLSQAYDAGWKAYTVDVKCQRLDVRCYLPFIFGKEIKNHVLVNNWANGWMIDNRSQITDQKIVIVFLPQYLEYIGFISLVSTFVTLVIYSISRPKKS